MVSPLSEVVADDVAGSNQEIVESSEVAEAEGRLLAPQQSRDSRKSNALRAPS